MKSLVTIAAALALAAVALVPALRAEDGPAPAPAAEKPAPAKASAEEIARHVRDLGSTEFEVRDRAYDALRKLGADAEPALREALKSDDLQIKISAERLLAERRAPAKADRSLETDDGWPRSRAEELLRRLAESGRVDLPPEALEAIRRAAELQRLDLHERFAKIRAEADRALGEIRLHAEPGPSTGRAVVRTNDETLSYEKAADGKIRVSIAKDGEEAKTYETESLDEMKTKHPEVYERVKGFTSDGGVIRLRLGVLAGGDDAPFGLWGRLPAEDGGDAPFELGGLLRGRLTLAPQGALGVHAEEVSDALRAQLGLAEGEGLVVQAVIDGSLAARCGVKPWDVVVAIDGKRVGSAEDVRVHLEARKGEEPVSLTVVRAAKRMALVETK